MQQAILKVTIDYDGNVLEERIVKVYESNTSLLDEAAKIFANAIRKEEKGGEKLAKMA